jgi:hypothetical protein
VHATLPFRNAFGIKGHDPTELSREANNLAEAIEGVADRDYPRPKEARRAQFYMGKEDTLAGKMKAWAEPTRRQSKQAKDFTDIVRLVEAHPELWPKLTPALQPLVKRPS